MVIYCATRKPPQETALHSLTQPHTASHSLTQPHLLKPLGQDADAAIGHRLQQWKDSHHLQSISRQASLCWVQLPSSWRLHSSMPYPLQLLIAS